MNIRTMTAADIPLAVLLYTHYYNEHETATWTDEKASRRISQIVTMQDSRSFVLEENGKLIGFCMGFLRQYDDITGFYLDEIVIDADWQNKGIGTKFMQMIEKTIRAEGVSCIELQSVSDELHEHFYTKNGFRNASNFIMKVKWFE